jgi:NAD-dependent SIR2 family protein deacetylase
MSPDAAIDEKLLERAGDAVRAGLDAGVPLVIAAGAGMGVDSGLPDFRGREGFWRAYPPYRHLGLAFEDLASPRWFRDDPALAWGFYGHRLNLYRRTVPHEGFDVLRAWADHTGDAFVFTSNVDGAFRKAGFAEDRLAEVHGAIDTWQCSRGAHGLWPAAPADIDIDEATLRARAPFPACPQCGALARPNIVMFGDPGFHDDRQGEQLERLDAFLAAIAPAAPLVVVECGAGTAIPTVRFFSERLLQRFGNATLVRINLHEAHADDDRTADRVVSIAAGARNALLAIGARCQPGPSGRSFPLRRERRPH